MDRFAKYSPIIVQLLLTILVFNHWYRGLEIVHLVYLWCILLGLSLPCILDIIYDNDDDELFDDEYFGIKCEDCDSYIDDEMLSLGSYKCEDCFDTDYRYYVDAKVQQEADDFYEGVNR